MKTDKNIEDPVARRRLKRKVLDRWENEGGRVCTEPADKSGSATPSQQGGQSENHPSEDGPATQVDK